MVVVVVGRWCPAVGQWRGNSVVACITVELQGIARQVTRGRDTVFSIKKTRPLKQFTVASAIYYPRRPSAWPLSQPLSCRSPPPLAVRDVRDGAALIKVHVEAVLVKVLGDHLARLDDAVLLGEVLFAKHLPHSTVSSDVSIEAHRVDAVGLTVSLDSLSENFLPTSLFCHSSVLLDEALVMPGTTRGMVGRGGVVWCWGSLS